MPDSLPAAATVPVRPNPGLHAGAAALLVGGNFLSGFNGMQQRAAQLAAAVGKLGYALHFVSIGPLTSIGECSDADVSVVCHAAGNASAQYDAFVRWTRASGIAPSLVLFGFTSLTVEVSQTLTRVPKSKLGRWRWQGGGGDAYGYDPEHVPRAHRCAQFLDAVAHDFPAAARVVFTDDIHFQRTRHVLELTGRMATLAPQQARVLDAAKEMELRTYAKARHVLLISEADRQTLLGGAAASSAFSTTDDKQRHRYYFPTTSVLPFGADARPDAFVTPPQRRVAGRMLFVGTCHPVAKASIAWFVRLVLPKIVRQSANAQLRVAGNGWQKLASEAPFAEWVDKGHLKVLGQVTPAEVEREYQSAFLFISPVLNSTGIATKVFHAMANGLNVLTTSIGTNGLLLPPKPIRLCKQRALSSGAIDEQQQQQQQEEEEEETPKQQHESLHPSKALFVADEPSAFADAALHSLRDEALWSSVSQHALRQLRMLSYSLQGAALARGVASSASASSSARSSPHHPASRTPAERAGIIVCDSCDVGPRRRALRRVISQLLRLRVAVHLILLPLASGPLSEQLILGGLQTQGVYVYSGSPEEQWTALQVASPMPPVSFAVKLPADEEDDGHAADDSTLLDCYMGGGGDHGGDGDDPPPLRLISADEMPAKGLGAAATDAAWRRALRITGE